MQMSRFKGEQTSWHFKQESDQTFIEDLRQGWSRHYNFVTSLLISLSSLCFASDKFWWFAPRENKLYSSEFQSVENYQNPYRSTLDGYVEGEGTLLVSYGECPRFTSLPFNEELKIKNERDCLFHKFVKAASKYVDVRLNAVVADIAEEKISNSNESEQIHQDTNGMDIDESAFAGNISEESFVVAKASNSSEEHCHLSKQENNYCEMDEIYDESGSENSTEFLTVSEQKVQALLEVAEYIEDYEEIDIEDARLAFDLAKMHIFHQLSVLDRACLFHAPINIREPGIVYLSPCYDIMSILLKYDKCRDFFDKDFILSLFQVSKSLDASERNFAANLLMTLAEHGYYPYSMVVLSRS